MGEGVEGGGGVDDEVKKWCTSTEQKYDVRPGISWGYLPMSMLVLSPQGESRIPNPETLNPKP